MRVNPLQVGPVGRDEWLEEQCRMLAGAGRSLAEVLVEVNERIERALDGAFGCHVSESQLFQAEAACRTIHDVQVAVQNGLFDCEHELRELREREVNPAELLVDGERLIRQYRFLRRRARIIDGLLGYLPSTNFCAVACLECMRHLRDTDDASPSVPLMAVPDCGFAVIALEELAEDEAAG